MQFISFNIQRLAKGRTIRKVMVGQNQKKIIPRKKLGKKKSFQA
jgi:hypothetical protein